MLDAEADADGSVMLDAEVDADGAFVSGVTTMTSDDDLVSVSSLLCPIR